MTTLPSPAVAAPPGLAHSLIGKKVVMAATGVVLLLFVVAHLAGNLKVFEGPARFNAYAEGLRAVGAPFFARGQVLWIVRGVLLVAVVAHLWAAIAVTRASWRARPVGYRQLAPVATTYAARTMRWGGVTSLRRWPVSLAYIVAVAAVGLHIDHGLWSAFQTLGLNRSPTAGWRRGIAGAVAGLITAGYIAIPLAVLGGVVR